MKRNKKRLITALIIIVAVAAVLVFMKFFNGNLLYISTGMGKSVVRRLMDRRLIHLRQKY